MPPPVDTPVTVVVLPGDVTVATDGLILVHVPPGVVLLSVVVAPEHTVPIPLMAAGKGFTVSTAVARPQVVV